MQKYTKYYNNKNGQQQDRRIIKCYNTNLNVINGNGIWSIGYSASYEIY